MELISNSNCEYVFERPNHVLRHHNWEDRKVFCTAIASGIVRYDLVRIPWNCYSFLPGIDQRRALKWWRSSIKTWMTYLRTLNVSSVFRQIIGRCCELYRIFPEERGHLMWPVYPIFLLALSRNCRHDGQHFVVVSAETDPNQKRLNEILD